MRLNLTEEKKFKKRLLLSRGSSGLFWLVGNMLASLAVVVGFLLACKSSFSIFLFSSLLLMGLGALAFAIALKYADDSLHASTLYRIECGKLLDELKEVTE